MFDAGMRILSHIRPVPQAKTSRKVCLALCLGAPPGKDKDSGLNPAGSEKLRGRLRIQKTDV
jgi:hypothetical protein